MKKITIIGYGRFGKTLYKLLKDDFDILVYSRRTLEDNTIAMTNDLQTAYENEVIFYAVPISAFEKVITSHKKYFTDKHLLIDVLSVKLHPKIIFDTYVQGSKTQILLTHPLFGPDSSKDGFVGLPIVLDQYRTNEKNYAFWKNFFEMKKLNTIEMTADEHDKLAAQSQSLTHFIGRLLDEFGVEPTAIDTLGAKRLLAVREQTGNDSWDLFSSLENYNPYSKAMLNRLAIAYEELQNKLLPEKVDPSRITIGIQGGKGSFNEEAIHYYLKRNQISEYTIEYLYTSENVLKALHQGTIDQGLFAIHNSVGGIVLETIIAMGQYNFRLIEEYAIKISHTLMMRQDAHLRDIDTIMTHPQVLAQCKSTLLQKYPNLKQTSGDKELIDHALVAQSLSENKLPKNIATMGSRVLADLYGLKIIEDNLQDLHDNYTSFLLVNR